MGKILDVVKRIFFTPDFSGLPMKNTVKQLRIEDWYLVKYHFHMLFCQTDDVSA
jgi:hypothetical protein